MTCCVAAIAVRFLTRRYIGEYNSDTEMMYQHETMVDHEAARLQLLDAATAQTPHQILRHLAWADAFIVVYDVTSRTSFVHARQLLHILHTHIPAVSYTHAAGDNDANTANALDINPQSTHDIQLRSGSNECPVSAHIPYVLQSHDTSAPDSHGTHTVNSPNTQSSYKQSTVSRCDLNTHFLSSHDIHIKDGQDSCVQGDNNTPVWSNHDVFKSNAKRFHQSNHTHLNYSHLPCQSSTASHTGSSCRYCSARSSSMVINAEESSRDIHQPYCRALNYIPHTGTSSQSVSHSSHHPNNYSLSINNRQVDSHCHNSNMHGLHIYRHQYQGNPRYASKQNKMTDKHINHNYINHQHNSREQFPTTYDCVICHDPIGSQNFINPAGLNLLHSRVLDADTPSDHSDTGIKNLKKQVHLSKTSFLKQSECMNRSVTYVNEFPVQSCHRDPRSNHGQQRIHCLHHTQQRRHSHRQNHLRHDIPSYSYQRGYNSNHNYSASNSFDSSHQRDCNQDHSHPPRSHSPDYSHVRGQDKDQSHLQHSPNNNHKSHGADRNHLKSYSSDHSPPKDHNPDHNHSRGYNPKHSRVKDHNLDHSYARDSNPGHSDQRDDSRDHSDARDSSPEPSFQREDSPDNYYSKDDSPDHKHLRGHTTLLLGNKRDLEHFRCVFTDEGEALSLEFSCQFYEVSAADSMLGVHLAFHSLLKEARALQFIRRLPQPSPKVSKSVLLSSAVSKVIGNFFTRTGAVPNKGSQIFDKLAQKC
nr:GATA zinc finger domain-containing protein 14-like [Cherax quadricarinatus]